jgi:Escherichia/Staphylococcus phage prohead protease
MPVVSYEDLPVADQVRAWDAQRARDRLLSAVGGSLDSSDAQERFRCGFVWYDDSAPQSLDSYRLLIADLVDGQLTAIPRAIAIAAGALNGGGADIPEADIAGARDNIERHYAKMCDAFDDEEIAAPWDSKSRIFRAREEWRRAVGPEAVERRWATVDRAEVREVRDDGSYDFAGHAAVFDSLSEDLGGGYFGSWHEQIKRGAFKDVLNDDVRLLFNHDPNIVLARTTSETLSLSEDTKGLFAEANVAPTSWGADLRVLLQRGDVSQMSFCFQVAEDEWYEDKDGNVLRTILSFKELFDVSAVTFPAYPQTDAIARGLQKLHLGQQFTAEERTALRALLDLDEEPEQDPGAEAQEPEVEADSSRAQVTRRAARARLRALQARL